MRFCFFSILSHLGEIKLEFVSTSFKCSLKAKWPLKKIDFKFAMIQTKGLTRRLMVSEIKKKWTSKNPFFKTNKTIWMDDREL